MSQMLHKCDMSEHLESISLVKNYSVQKDENYIYFEDQEGNKFRFKNPDGNCELPNHETVKDQHEFQEFLKMQKNGASNHGLKKVMCKKSNMKSEFGILNFLKGTPMQKFSFLQHPEHFEHFDHLELLEHEDILDSLEIVDHLEECQEPNSEKDLKDSKDLKGSNDAKDSRSFTNLEHIEELEKQFMKKENQRNQEKWDQNGNSKKLAKLAKITNFAKLSKIEKHFKKGKSKLISSELIIEVPNDNDLMPTDCCCHTIFKMKEIIAECSKNCKIIISTIEAKDYIFKITNDRRNSLSDFQIPKTKYYEKIEIINKVMKIIHNMREFLLNPSFEKMVLNILTKSQVKNFMTNLIFINEILELPSIHTFFKNLELDFKNYGYAVISKKYEDSRKHVHELYSRMEEFKQELNFLKHFKTHLEPNSPKESEKSLKEMLSKEMGECYSHRKKRKEPNPEKIDPALVAQQWELLESKLNDYEEAQKKMKTNVKKEELNPNVNSEKSKHNFKEKIKKKQTNGKNNSGDPISKKTKKGKDTKNSNGNQELKELKEQQSTVETNLKQNMDCIEKNMKESKVVKDVKEVKDLKDLKDPKDLPEQKVQNINQDQYSSPESLKSPENSKTLPTKKKKNKNKSKKKNKSQTQNQIQIQCQSQIQNQNKNTSLKEEVNVITMKTNYLGNIRKTNHLENEFLEEVPKSCNLSDLNSYNQSTNSLLQSLEMNWMKISSRPVLVTSISKSGMNQLKGFCKMIQVEVGLNFC